MKHITALLLLVPAVLWVLCCQPLAANDQADKIVSEAVQGAGGDIDRAEKVLKALKKAGEDPEVRWAMLEHAFAYAIKAAQFAEGRKAAAKALDMLAAESEADLRRLTVLRAEYWRRAYKHTAPGREKEDAGYNLVTALLRLADQHEKDGQYDPAMAVTAEAAPAAGVAGHDQEDNLPVRQKRLDFLKLARQKADNLIEMSKQPNAPASMRGELVQMLLVDLDRPSEAAKYLNDDVDQVTRTYVPLAAKPPAEVQVQACRELGDWYYSDLAGKAAPFAKLAMYNRAQTWYDQFMARYETSDATKMKVLLLQKDLAAQRQKAWATVDPAGASKRYLSDLPEAEAKVGAGTLGKNGLLGVLDSNDKPIRVMVRGRAHTHALGLHPPHQEYGTSHVSYRLNGEFRTLKGSAALNDSAGKGAASSVSFEVFGDNRRLWHSAPMTKAGTIEPFNLNITGVRVLKIQVRCAASHRGAHAVMLDPAVIP